MNKTALCASPAGSAGFSGVSETRLPGHWLVPARIACGAGALLAVGLFTSGLVIRFAHLGHLASYDVPSDWSPDTLRAALAQVGLATGFYQLYRVVCDLIFAL